MNLEGATSTVGRAAWIGHQDRSFVEACHYSRTFDSSATTIEPVMRTTLRSRFKISMPAGDLHYGNSAPIDEDFNFADMSPGDSSTPRIYPLGRRASGALR